MQTILFPYKLCVTEKRTYVNKLKFFFFLIVLFSIPFNELPRFYYRELAEMLDNLKCINLLKLPKSDEKCSLFSKPMVSETENADILDEATDIIVEPATDAMLKLATFTNHAAQHLVCPCHTE